MLERASLSAECTAHFFLRNFEAPTRSQRGLGSAFWRHGGDNLNIPAWWPAYLARIRNKAKTSTPALSRFCTRPNGSHGLRNRKGRPHCRPSPTVFLDDGKSRAYTGTSIRTQEQQALMAGMIHIGEREYTSQESDQQDREKGFPKLRLSKFQNDSFISTAMQNVTHTTPTKRREDFCRAWSLFIQSGHKQDMAQDMMHLLAQSSNKTDLGHVLTTFDFIPVHKRNKKDYEVIIQAAVDLQKYQIAVNMLHQAIPRGLGANAYFRFVAHCVENTLWNTLAALWKSLGLARKYISQGRKITGRHKSPNFAGKYAFHFNDVDDLPGKLVSLASRLEQKDAVLAAHRETLVDICKRLTYVAAESQKVMATITGKGVLALFYIQEQLNFNSKLHLAALGTMSKMQDRGAKSQLALLIYRNLRFRYPNLQVPAWVYGTLVGISASGNQPPETYKYLIDEFKQQHDRADDRSYQQAMAACAKQGEVDAVFKLFNDFCKASGPKDLRDVHHLLYVFAVSGNSESTQAQFDRLSSEFGFKPDVVSWTILLLAHARSPHSETAFDIFKAMKAANINANAVGWSILMTIAARRGDIDMTRRLYKEAANVKIVDSIYLAGSLVECLLRNNDVQEAESVALEMSRLDAPESTIRLWNSLLRYHAFKADSASIQRTQGLMRSVNVEPDNMTYAALMTVLVVKGQTMDAVKVLRTLHFSRHIHPTEFHYSILIHGFTLERRRDLAIAVYHEMLEHFPRSSPSAKLAMLHLGLHRDEAQNDIQAVPWNALDHLAEVLLENPLPDIASNTPNPGFGRRNVRDGLEAVYFQSLIAFLQRKGKLGLSEQFLETSERLSTKYSNLPALQIQTLALKLQLDITRQEWVRVDKIWEKLVEVGTQSGSALSEHLLGGVLSHKMDLGNAPSIYNAERIAGDEFTFKSMITPTASAHGEAKILRASQYLLSRPLSIYLQALDQQGRYHDMILIVQQLQAFGFCLSNQNWNRYVQLLSKSPTFEHTLMAFTLFEKHLLPNAPHWNLLRRGKWLPRTKRHSSDRRSTMIPQSRKMLEKSRPEFLVPSYYTVVYLSTVLAKAKKSFSLGNGSEMWTLDKSAPGTVRLVRRTPYLADRIQGILLRGRSIVGDRVSRPRHITESPDTSGVRGSQSLLDNLPSEIIETIGKSIGTHDSLGHTKHGRTTRNTTKSRKSTIEERLSEHVQLAEQRSGRIDRSVRYLPEIERYETRDELQRRIQAEESAKLQPSIDLAEQAVGEIIHGPQFLDAQGRYETESEVRSRILKEKVRLLDISEKLRNDFSETPLVGTIYRGEPVIHGISRGQSLTKSKSTDASSLVEVLLNGRPDDISKVVSAGHVQHFRDAVAPHADIVNLKEGGTAIQFATFNNIRYNDAKTTASSMERGSRGDKLGSRTSTLRPSTVSASVKRTDTATRTQSVNKRAWSVNKTLRLLRLQEKQQRTRLKLSARKALQARRAMRSRTPVRAKAESSTNVRTEKT